MGLSPIFRIPLGMLPVFFNTPLGYPNTIGLYWYLELNAFTVRITHLSNRIILLKINTTTETTLFTLIFTLGLPLVMMDPYIFILLRLSKEADFGNLLFTLRPWKLPPLDCYKTYGEAKNRIKDLFKNGTKKEKLAVYTLTIGYLLMYLSIILYTLSLADILVFNLLNILFVILPILLLILVIQRFAWKTIT